MTKMLRGFVPFIAGILLVFMLTACGSDDIITDEPVPARFLSATPPGGEIAANSTITIAFDNPPTDVTVSAGTVTVSRKNATIAGPFTPGPLALTITWANGTLTLNYNVISLGCCGGVRVVGGTVRDGDTDVDYEFINTDGVIEIAFTEEVTGNITLHTEDGADVGWIGKFEKHFARLELVKGRELAGETTYVIKTNVSDALGNAFNFSITFVTRGKE